ncbi:MAG: type II toxin-antitoxin system PemK/MazF family toxin [Clostridiales bacterium]|jgi:mRNA interferase MazF|nr:type II toxin-antitoxin system PemK/MazF family toxin [Clostridiales bacterium]
MMHNQGDIILVPLPFTDLSASKRRPVLVVSKRSYNDVADDVVVVSITSSPGMKPYEVRITKEDMLEGLLKKDSCIRADRVYTLAQSIVQKHFGRVKPEIVQKVKEKIFELMDENSEKDGGDEGIV